MVRRRRRKSLFFYCSHLIVDEKFITADDRPGTKRLQVRRTTFRRKSLKKTDVHLTVGRPERWRGRSNRWSTGRQQTILRNYPNRDEGGKEWFLEKTMIKYRWSSAWRKIERSRTGWPRTGEQTVFRNKTSVNKLLLDSSRGSFNRGQVCRLWRHLQRNPR